MGAIKRKEQKARKRAAQKIVETTVGEYINVLTKINTKLKRENIIVWSLLSIITTLFVSGIIIYWWGQK